MPAVLKGTQATVLVCGTPVLTSSVVVGGLGLPAGKAHSRSRGLLLIPVCLRPEDSAQRGCGSRGSPSRNRVALHVRPRGAHSSLATLDLPSRAHCSLVSLRLEGSIAPSFPAALRPRLHTVLTLHCEAPGGFLSQWGSSCTYKHPRWPGLRRGAG